MTTNLTNNLIEMKMKLSALWMTVLFNMLFRDLHEFARSGFIDEIIAMTSNGAEVPQGLLLAAAIFLQIPIGMIFLTQILNIKFNRWANMIAAGLTLVMIIGNNLAPDLDDLFFAIVECAALALVIFYAWHWSNE